MFAIGLTIERVPLFRPSNESIITWIIDHPTWSNVSISILRTQSQYAPHTRTTSARKQEPFVWWSCLSGWVALCGSLPTPFADLQTYPEIAVMKGGRKYEPRRRLRKPRRLTACPHPSLPLCQAVPAISQFRSYGHHLAVFGHAGYRILLVNLVSTKLT